MRNISPENTGILKGSRIRKCASNPILDSYVSTISCPQTWNKSVKCVSWSILQTLKKSKFKFSENTLDSWYVKTIGLWEQTAPNSWNQLGSKVWSAHKQISPQLAEYHRKLTISPQLAQHCRKLTIPLHAGSTHAIWISMLSSRFLEIFTMPLFRLIYSWQVLLTIFPVRVFFFWFLYICRCGSAGPLQVIFHFSCCHNKSLEFGNGVASSTLCGDLIGKMTLRLISASLMHQTLVWTKFESKYTTACHVPVIRICLPTRWPKLVLPEKPGQLWPHQCLHLVCLSAFRNPSCDLNWAPL